MSEYQFYEFQTIDRRLSADQMTALQSLSRRVELTASSAIFTYSYGDFRGQPLAVLEQYFDAMLYVANWGSKQLAFRFPRLALDMAAIEPYINGEEVTLTTTDHATIVNIGFHEEEPMGWIEGTGILTPMIPLYEDIVCGDYRALYLAWLKIAISTEVLFEEEDTDLIEPPVPAGLGQLTPALHALIAFFDIDPDLVAAAAETSPSLEHRVEPLEQWVTLLPPTERDALLVRIARGELHGRTEILRRLREVGQDGHIVLPTTTERRTFAEIQQATHRQRQKRQQQEQAEAERARLVKLDDLARRETQVWQKVEQGLARRTASGYDEAVALLSELRDLAQHRGQRNQFDERLATVLAPYASSAALQRRLKQVRLA